MQAALAAGQRGMWTVEFRFEGLRIMPVALRLLAALTPAHPGLRLLFPDAGATALAKALRHALDGLEAEWLPRLDAATQAALRNPDLALTLGLALVERQLWGKARSMLMSAANDQALDTERRRTAWAALGQLAEREHRDDEAARFYRRAALPGERD